MHDIKLLHLGGYIYLSLHFTNRIFTYILKVSVKNVTACKSLAVQKCRAIVTHCKGFPRAKLILHAKVFSCAKVTTYKKVLSCKKKLRAKITIKTIKNYDLIAFDFFFC